MLDSVKNDRSRDFLMRLTDAWPTGGVAWPMDDAALDGVAVVVADVAAGETNKKGTLITLLNTLTSSKSSPSIFLCERKAFRPLFFHVSARKSPKLSIT